MICVNLLKKPLADGQIVVWWPAALQGDDCIDVASIPDRSAAQQKATASFAEVYKQAHEAFKQRVKEIQPVVLDLPDDADQDADQDADAQERGNGSGSGSGTQDGQDQ